MSYKDNKVGVQEISSSDGHKRVRLSLSAGCFLDRRVPIRDIEDDVTVIAQTYTPPSLNVDNPFDLTGKTRIDDRDFVVTSMFNLFAADLYSERSGSRFMTMVRY